MNPPPPSAPVIVEHTTSPDSDSAGGKKPSRSPSHGAGERVPSDRRRILPAPADPTPAVHPNTSTPWSAAAELRARPSRSARASKGRDQVPAPTS